NTSEFSHFFQVPEACVPIVTNTDDSGPGSLRAAIECANSMPGTDTISFNIPGPGVHTISLLPALPAITASVIIDGYTQPGASANTLAVGDNAVLLIELNGTATSNGLVIGSTGSGSTIKGLVINWVAGTAIVVDSDNNVIAGNFIGTDPTGATA